LPARHKSPAWREAEFDPDGTPAIWFRAGCQPAEPGWGDRGEARRSGEFILAGSHQVGDSAPSQPILMGNLASPIFLPAGLLLLASADRLQSRNLPPPRPWIPRTGISSAPELLYFPLITPPSPGAGKAPWFPGRDGDSGPEPGGWDREGGCSPRSALSVSLSQKCSRRGFLRGESKAVLAARLILHGDKIKKNQPEVLPSRTHSPGAGAEAASCRRTSPPGLPAARPSLLLLLLGVSPAFFRRPIQF